jgi:hypothetical protein
MKVENGTQQTADYMVATLMPWLLTRQIIIYMLQQVQMGYSYLPIMEIPGQLCIMD